MNEDSDFARHFKTLTDNAPFPWQEALYERFVSESPDNIPAACNLPTGLGKTSVIAVWLLALASHHNKMPRRLVYVVNRRTVVDQTTDEVVKYRDRIERPENHLLKKKIGQLALSTLRGQFADNREWSADPSRSAVICGTVDMIGSRLLFSGYGCGFKTRPLHAGFLGQDALLIHDEAHLEPAFQKLLIAIEKEQTNGRTKDFRPLRVMELSATSRGGGETFELTEKDRQHDIVHQRIHAKKQLRLIPVKDEKKLAEEITDLALEHRDSKRAILVFVRLVEDVKKVTDKLDKAKQKYETLTGTLRGKERDELVTKPIFIRFLPDAKKEDETVYLVCTSAGEVGVNISADHLVCDLSTFESMAQRFGRVNRFGIREDTRIDVIHPHPADFKDDKLDQRLKRTLALLELLNSDASPQALSELPAAERQAAFAPEPTILPVTDILFDAWALTTIKDKLPGRPPVEAYLHGITDYDPPQTQVAWREEVEWITPEILFSNRLDYDDILEMYPLKPQEILSGATKGKNKVFEQLESIAERDRQHEWFAWVIDLDSSVTRYSLSALVARDKQNNPLLLLGGRTVLLPPAAGGLKDGLLTGDEPFSPKIPYDVSASWYADKECSIKRRDRQRSDNPKPEAQSQMRPICSINLQPDLEDDANVMPGRYWHWYVRSASADDDGSKNARIAITWDHHTNDVTERASALADSLLSPGSDLHDALKLAALHHDLGKRRELWQRSIGNPNPDQWYAKSGKHWKSLPIGEYRHEFGSLLDVIHQEDDFKHLTTAIRDLVLHFIATHHGYARPHFPLHLIFDPNYSQAQADESALEVPRRFARLQRKYGRWGLAYVESLLRAADYAASAKPSEVINE